MIISKILSTKTVSSWQLSVNTSTYGFISWQNRIKDDIYLACGIKSIDELEQTSLVKCLMAKMIILHNITSHLQFDLSDDLTSYQIWKFLENKFKSLGTLDLIRTFEKINKLKANVGKMALFFNQIESHFQVINFYDSNLLSEMYKSALVLSKLPEKYHPYKDVHADSDQFDYTLIKAAILKTDRSLLSKVVSIDDGIEQDSNENITDSANSYENSGSSVQVDTHPQNLPKNEYEISEQSVSHERPQQEVNSNQKKYKRRLRCSYCKRYGHVRRFCYQLQDDEEDEEDDDDDNYYYDEDGNCYYYEYAYYYYYDEESSEDDDDDEYYYYYGRNRTWCWNCQRYGHTDSNCFYLN